MVEGILSVVGDSSDLHRRKAAPELVSVTPIRILLGDASLSVEEIGRRMLDPAVTIRLIPKGASSVFPLRRPNAPYGCTGNP